MSPYSSAQKEDLGARQLAAMAAVEKLAQSKTAKVEPSPFAAIDFGSYAKRIVSFLARNFFTMKFIALVSMLQRLSFLVAERRRKKLERLSLLKVYG